MTELVATTPGLFPLPDWAKEELSDLKGHQKGDLISGHESGDIVAAYDRARAEVLEDQHDAGLDRVVEGQLRWDDMLAHPLTVHDSVETGGIVRYYDNNNFYRDPQIRGELDFSGDVAAELDAAAELTDEPLQAVLPGPYSLSDLATDDYYGSPEDLLAGVTDFLAGEVDAFGDIETLFLLEPSLVASPPSESIQERLADALSQVASETDADVVVQTYWGAVDEKTYAHLMDADVEALGFDIVAGDRDQTVYNVSEYGTFSDVALGLVDGQNTRVETSETVRERVDWFTDQVPAQEFDRVYLTSNTELFYLPVSRSQAKLGVLAEAAATEEEEVEA